jgi:cytochrome c oxidase subunit 3
MRSLYSQLTDRSWETQGVGDQINDRSAGIGPAARTALGFLLAVLTSMFLLFAVGYRMRMMLPDWQAIADPRLLWLNTGLLILSSIFLQRAKGATAEGRLTGLRNNLMVGWLLTAGFLFGQYLAWTQVSDAGVFAANSPAAAFFYLLVGLHGLHLFGGLLVCSWAALRVWQKIEVARIRLLVDLCTTYWHYLLLVWLGFFVLLLST